MEKEKLPDLEYAKVALDCNHQEKAFSEVRSSQLSDAFTKLEVQIATVLFAFVGLFVKFVDTGYAGYQDYAVLLIKLMFAAIVFSLVASLTFGLIQLKRKEQFWNEMMRQKLARFEGWRDVLSGDLSLEAAKALHKGSKLDKGAIRSTPSWPWIMQTIMLGIAVTFMLVLFVIFVSQKV